MIVPFNCCDCYTLLTTTQVHTLYHNPLYDQEAAKPTQKRAQKPKRAQRPAERAQERANVMDDDEDGDMDEDESSSLDSNLLIPVLCVA